MPELQRSVWALPCDDASVRHLCGVIRPVGWARIGRSLPTLAQAGPNLVADPTQSVLLYKCFEAVFNGPPDYPPQQIGDCVSFGHGHALDALQVVECYLGQLDQSVIHRAGTEFIYGAARKVSNDLGNFDGSYGGAAIKALTTVGAVSYAEYAQAGETTAYEGSRAKQWGRTGPPAALEAIAASHKLGAGALLTGTDDMIAALQNGHPCTICTARGFTMVRDATGACKLSGRWGHCMHVTAYRGTDSKMPPAFCVIQSWGPDQPTGPLVLDQPSYSFWSFVPDMAQIIDEGDSFALAGAPGFAPKAMPPELTAA